MKSIFKRLLNGIVKKLFSRCFVTEAVLSNVYARIKELEYRSYNRRFYAIEQIADFMISAQVPGDYCEFGVYKGSTFIHAYRHMASHIPGMMFYAFDSFEGLPKPRGIDAQNGYASNFHEGEFAFSLEEFQDNLRREDLDLSRVKTVKGWFDQTLRNTTLGIAGISAAWIDCDLYESTVPVLEFMTPLLQTGSVIAFDDWHCYRNHPDFGEQRACREWLLRNPNIRLNELLSFGVYGMVFTVQLTDSTQ